MRMNSTRKRAKPVSTRYAAKTEPAGSGLLRSALRWRSNMRHRNQAMAQATINS